ncbi:MAG: phosphatase PAP2 family protein [Acidimicrobiales bacterium]
MRRLLRRVAVRDTAVSEALVRHHPRIVDAGLARLSNAADHSKLWVGLGAVLAASGSRRGRRAAQRGLLAVSLASAVTNGVLKPLLPRPRPPVRGEGFVSLVRRPSSSSFPSGHAASAAAFATAVALESPAAAAPIGALAALVAYSRISTGVHYPSDVLVGGAVGAAVAVGTTRLWPRVDPSPAEARPAWTTIGSEPTPDGAGVVIVVNAAAGPDAHAADIATIEAALPAARIIRVEEPAELDDAYVEAGRSAVALGVLGGDGTISGAAAAALDADVPLAVFPGGTLNHFARDLGIDTVDDAIDAVRQGNLVEVDVGTIDGRVFLNTASFGGYSEFVEARHDDENRIGKWPATAVALARVLTSGTPTTVSLDDETRTIWMIFIGNCAYDPPGFSPASRARLDDRTLDLRVIDGTAPRARLRLIAAVATGRLGRSEVYTRRLVERLAVDVGTPTATLAADGETFDGNGSFVVTKDDRRLRTFAPAD